MSAMTEKWEAYASKHLVGRTIKSVRYLSEEECGSMDWYEGSLVINLDDGTLIFPSLDDEGNGPGALFGQGPNGEELTFPVINIDNLDKSFTPGGKASK